ncbi:hypothetical protein BDN67DRAFT_1013971 [Paxillus ammoniavirescens]|nr:hypothetical protein BDN67DRAFT_1013971 [Paxillus ammoniavirescens]
MGPKQGALRVRRDAAVLDVVRWPRSRRAKRHKPSSKGLTRGVDGLAFFPDGRHLVSGSREAETSDSKQDRHATIEDQGNAEHRQEQDPPEVMSEEDTRSETSSTRQRLDMLAVGFSLSGSGAGAEASYYDHEGDFWEGFNRAGPSDATWKEEEKAEDPNEDKPDANSQRRIFQWLKRLRRSLNPSKTPKDGPRNLSPQQEVPSIPENTDGASPHANPIVSHLPADVEQIDAHRALEDGHGVDILDPPSASASTSILRSHCPVSKFMGRRACIRKNLQSEFCRILEEFIGGITAVYSAYAPEPHVAAADLSKPSQVPEQGETVLGDYVTHSVIPDIPADTQTNNDHHDGPKENPDVHSPGVFCGLHLMLFSCRSTPNPNTPGDANSGIEMAELRRQTEDEQISVTAMSTRPATSTANATKGTQREQIDRQSAHDTAIEVERLRLEGERLRIEVQEKQAAHELRQERLRIEGERLRIEAQEKQAAHKLLILDRQIELARIHVGYSAPGLIDPPQN